RYQIPVWEIGLADDSKKHPKKMVGKKFIDPKLDGIRLTTVINVEDKTVKMFTRSGNLNTNFDHIAKMLEKIIPLLPESIVLDGEMVDKNFQMLMTQVNRKKDVNTEDAYYALFDMLLLRDFENGGTTMGQKDRHDGLLELAPYLQD